MPEYLVDVDRVESVLISYKVLVTADTEEEAGRLALERFSKEGPEAAEYFKEYGLDDGTAYVDGMMRQGRPGATDA